MAINKEKISDLLLQAEYINEQQLNEAFAEQKKTGDRIGRILVKKGYLSEQALVQVLQAQLGIPHVELGKRQISSDVVRLVPENVARAYQVFPVDRKENRLVLGMLDPANVLLQDNLQIILGLEIQPVILTEEDLNRALNQYYGMTGSMREVLKDIDVEAIADTKEEDEETSDPVEEAPIVRLVNLLIFQAVREKASDIHLEPTGNFLQVRYRVDGRLRQVMTSPKRTQAAIISRIKIISGMNIAEKRAPQDGRIQMRVDGTAVDLRVSSIPTVFGEKIVMRVLYKNNVLTKLGNLGFLPQTLEKFRTVYTQPHGIILVTGPTGSGKSTTLSAVLNELNSPEVNIMTVEDPVEYQIAGINQVQVNTKAGLNFATALRAFLRQDPDIIMVGEIRDQETAKIAIQSALTGHLVLSTLHTNDACSSITRLIDMQIEPFLVASTVTGVLAQRLVRAVCNNCQEPYRLSPADPYYKVVKDNLGEDYPDEKLVFYRGKGCRQCNGSGHLKRLALHEVLLISRELRALVSSGASADQIKDLAAGQGMKTLFQDGLAKALAGRTSLDEVFRVAYTLK